jgi:hypothetical protein
MATRNAAFRGAKAATKAAESAATEEQPPEHQHAINVSRLLVVLEAAGGVGQFRPAGQRSPEADAA